MKLQRKNYKHEKYIFFIDQKIYKRQNNKQRKCSITLKYTVRLEKGKVTKVLLEIEGISNIGYG